VPVVRDDAEVRKEPGLLPVANPWRNLTTSNPPASVYSKSDSNRCF
jgi:hypothetical protein